VKPTEHWRGEFYPSSKIFKNRGQTTFLAPKSWSVPYSWVKIPGTVPLPPFFHTNLFGQVIILRRCYTQNIHQKLADVHGFGCPLSGPEFLNGVIFSHHGSDFLNGGRTSGAGRDQLIKLFLGKQCGIMSLIKRK